jgi:hypothetical protein
VKNGQGVIDEVLEGGFRTKATGTAGQAALLTAMARRWHEGVISRLLRQWSICECRSQIDKHSSRLKTRYEAPLAACMYL